eukprot:CAMPEP_0118894558 /NCGR_PEP_ID=MMETSP1166-20130328/3285_1 /TAXON_ID=1104430 /ORGANISM="Chrysoreinhardia sp, Strain CCMP3193" /LENGTH=271 /DNA_ID=CAMNT_0006833483 /DNA_START=434 /DNA_END=1245 /DNA_ORIENTATION=-
MSWNPDGSCLALPNASKAQQPVSFLQLKCDKLVCVKIAAIVARDEWHDVCADLFGHSSPITVARFSPVQYGYGPQVNNGKTAAMSVVAVGSQDATVSIWTSCTDRPLVVMRDCFGGAVSDMSWSNEGGLLVACSHDGSLLVIEFDHYDLGLQGSPADVIQQDATNVVSPFVQDLSDALISLDTQRQSSLRLKVHEDLRCESVHLSHSVAGRASSSYEDDVPQRHSSRNRVVRNPDAGQNHIPRVDISYGEASPWSSEFQRVKWAPELGVEL